MVWVSALSGVGAGGARGAGLQSGVEPVLPAAPRNLALSNIAAHSVLLQFTPAFDGNSSISLWTVQVTLFKSFSTSDKNGIKTSSKHLIYVDVGTDGSQHIVGDDLRAERSGRSVDPCDGPSALHDVPSAAGGQ